jgi:hypothetical protein
MPNIAFKGFRWVHNRWAPTSMTPPIEVVSVATGYASAIKIGDPVKRLSTGYVDLCAATEVAYGVMVGAEQYWDGSRLRKGGHLPASTAWGTNEERRSLIRVIPVDGQEFEVTADDATTATTYAAYLAFIGENVPYVVGTGVGDYSGYQADISLHATTDTLDFRITDIPGAKDQDFASANVRLRGVFNLAYRIGADTRTGT